MSFRACSSCTIAATSMGLFGAAVLAFSLAAGPAQHAPAPASTQSQTATDASAPREYKVDSVHSRALFRVQHLGSGMFWGRFNDVGGTFTCAPGTADGLKFNVVIKTESVDSGVEKLDQHLRAEDFFAVKDFPEMSFVSTSARKTGDNTYDVAGDLTLHGVTKPIVAKLEYTGGRGARAGFEATFAIKRSDFGMKYGVDNGALGDEVRVVVALEGILPDSK